MTSAKRPQGVPAYDLWPREAARARGRLYPATALYTAYTLALLAWAVRPPHVVAAAFFFAAGIVVWTVMEYFIHRYILHGRFPDGPGIVQHFFHKRFDHLHWEHHERPWDGTHINGRIMDTLPFSVVFIVIAAFFPIWSAPMLVAGMLQSYVVEEWVHHSVHFYHFQNPYFRYIKRHHLYHHSPMGAEVGYGLTNGVWDIVFSTRIAAEQRRRLYAPTGERNGLDTVAADADERATLGPSHTGAGPLSPA
jgi:sterol desaturase/sphingolipid hydroxylase (fatty acid hydroxylase superfamily)